MDYQASIVLFAQEEAPSFLRLLGPLVVIIGLAVFRWLSELAKKKEREQQAAEDAQRGREAQGQSRQTRPIRPGVPSAGQSPARVRPRRSEPIHRYQPEIPAGSPQQEQRDWREATMEEVILAKDVSPDLAEMARQRLREQGERQLRAEAIRRAKAQQAQRRQQAAARQVMLAAEKAARQERSRSLHDGKFDTDKKVARQPSGAFLPLTAAKSPAQLRQAIVWAEILGSPRALRPLQEVF